METESLKHAARAVTDGETVLANVEVALSPERVFQALTTDEVERWWGSVQTYRITDWAADLRVGGRWSLVVRLPDGSALPASGEFLEIDAPRKIVQTRRYDWDHPLLGRRETTVTYRPDPVEAGTRVTVRHEGFGRSEPAHEHAAGWERFLGWLDAYMRPAPQGQELPQAPPTNDLSRGAPMANDLEHVRGMFKTNTELVRKATEGIQPDHWFLKPGRDSNHLLWVTGHLIGSRAGVIKALGGEWSTPWGSLFARGAVPVPADQYPGVEEVRSAWIDVSERLSAALADAPAEVLAMPTPEGKRSFDGKISGVVAFLAFHETYHVGQVSYLRKWLGYGQTVG